MPLVRDNDALEMIELTTPGEWVRVKRRMSRGDEIAVEKAIAAHAQIRVDVTGMRSAEPQAEAIEAAEFAILELVIREWSFDEPLTPAALRLLDPDDADLIKRRLNELYASRTDDERKNLSAATPPPSPDLALSHVNSNGSA